MQEEHQENKFNYNFSKDSLPEEFKERKISISSIEKADGDCVKKGDIICFLGIEREYIKSIKIIANTDGVIEFFKFPSNDYFNPTYISENEKIFTIYEKTDEQVVLELKNKRFKNIPLIKVDEFNGVKEIKWESVAGQHKTSQSRFDLCDSLLFYSDEINRDKLFFTFNNLEGKDYIIFRYLTKEYKLAIESKVLFLFDSGEVIEFIIINESHKFIEHYNWGHIFETRVQLILQDLETLKTKDLSKWQIQVSKTGKKITGSINSVDTQFSIKKLVSEYHELVQMEIINYQPLRDKQFVLSYSNNEAEYCYIYLMIDLTNNYHKIGISNNPDFREKTLQSEKPTIEIICKKRFPNRKIASSFEQALHQAYKLKRIRGEWFNLADNEVQELKEVLTS